jgi:hypothetical protein
MTGIWAPAALWLALGATLLPVALKAAPVRTAG